MVGLKRKDNQRLYKNSKIPIKNKLVKMTPKKLKCLMDWAYNTGKSNQKEYMFRFRRDEKIGEVNGV